MEVFADGNCGYASSTEQSLSTRLGELPIPDLLEIAEDPQFSPKEISNEEFEVIWNKRYRTNNRPSDF